MTTTMRCMITEGNDTRRVRQVAAHLQIQVPWYQGPNVNCQSVAAALRTFSAQASAAAKLTSTLQWVRAFFRARFSLNRSQMTPKLVNQSATLAILYQGACLICLLAIAHPVAARQYRQAAGSTLVFASQYDGEIFTGSFAHFQTNLDFDPDHLEQAQLDVSVDLTSVRTGNQERDTTLRGPDFFDSAVKPTARFQARQFQNIADHKYRITGTLTLGGINRPVTLNMTWEPGQQPVLHANTFVKRLDFGVGHGDWSDTKTLPNAVAISTRVILNPN